MKKSALIFCAGIIVGFGATFIAGRVFYRSRERQLAPIIDNGRNEITRPTIQPSNPHSLPHSQWPQEWIRVEAFMNASQTCQAKIKTRTFNPETIHWDSNHPTQAYYEQVHVVVWYFDSRNDYGDRLYWQGICNFDGKGDLDNFMVADRKYNPEIDKIN